LEKEVAGSALCEGSPADFRRKIEFFVFAPLKAERQKRAFHYFACLI